MNGVHDMGGMHGFGPVAREQTEPLFHAEWEERVFGINLLIPERVFTVDAARHGIELMAPAEYLRAPYYARWLASAESNLIAQGVLTAEDLDARTEALRRQPNAQFPRLENPAPAWSDDEVPAEPLPVLQPRFAVGDAVVTRNQHPAGHTRLPRYARAKRGVIRHVHGPAVFPDTNAHGLGANPQVVYNVRFDARELWGAAAEPRGMVYLDLWESYLDPVPD
jgi:nitrile hydratase